jgi:hypothetical protein
MARGGRPGSPRSPPSFARYEQTVHLGWLAADPSTEGRYGRLSSGRRSKRAESRAIAVNRRTYDPIRQFLPDRERNLVSV